MTDSNDPWSEAELVTLRARAVSLGRPVVQRAAAELPTLRVRIGGERYGVDAGAVAACAAVTTLTPLPGAPPELAGMTVRGGELLPVFDLRAVLGLKLTALPERARILIVGEGAGRLALLVDAVEEARSVAALAVEHQPAVPERVRAFVSSFDHEGIPLLNLDALLASDRLVVRVGKRTGGHGPSA